MKKTIKQTMKVKKQKYVETWKRHDNLQEKYSKDELIKDDLENKVYKIIDVQKHYLLVREQKENNLLSLLSRRSVKAITKQELNIRLEMPIRNLFFPRFYLVQEVKRQP